MRKIVRYSIKAIIVLIVFIISTIRTHSQELNSNQIDSLVDFSMTLMPQQAGIAIGIVKDGKIIHAKGYGFASLERKKLVDENTLFAIASNSKAFTATALAILVEEGKLSWNDKVVKHIPEFKMYDPYVTENFNIIDLITHRSGLGLGSGDLMIFPGGSDFTVNDILVSFQYMKPVSAFRTKYDYDNLLFIVAGEIIARKSGMTWIEFIETKIMKPLGMSRSRATFQNTKGLENIATPYISQNNGLTKITHYDLPLSDAAAGIYSSVNDMCKWMLVNLNKGKFGEELDQQLFNDYSQKMIWYPHTNLSFYVSPNNKLKNHFKAYGLGWYIMDYNGYYTLSHTGLVAGMLSRTILIPEMNVGVVVLTNSFPGGSSHHAISQSIIDAYLGLKNNDWVIYSYEKDLSEKKLDDSVSNKVWETVEKAKGSEIDYKNYIGVYEDKWFGKVEVFLKDDKLWFRSLRSPKINGEMFFYKATTFAIKMEYTDFNCDAFATFNLDHEGKAYEFKMKGISPFIDFSFDFQDLHLVRVLD